MRPRPITPADLDRWAPYDPQPTRFTGPDEVEHGIEPCPAIVTSDHDGLGRVVRVPWELDEIELAHLARTGTIWLSTWGGLPVHSLEVQEP